MFRLENHSHIRTCQYSESGHENDFTAYFYFIALSEQLQVYMRIIRVRLVNVDQLV